MGEEKSPGKGKEEPESLWRVEFQEWRVRTNSRPGLVAWGLAEAGLLAFFFFFSPEGLLYFQDFFLCLAQGTDSCC